MALPTPVQNTPHTLTLEPYLEEESLHHRYTKVDFPSQVILAHQDNDDAVVVYQAFSSSIADFAVQHQSFKGAPGYKLERMTWIKPSFLWMQYRSGWNTKDDRQERTLAIRLRRSFFDSLVNSAVSSSHHLSANAPNARDHWRKARSQCCVTVQWDPDYTPNVEEPERIKAQRRAIQLGLKGPAAAILANGVTSKEEEDGVLSIEDITPFVIEMRTRLERDKNKKGDLRFADLWVPKERPYQVEDTSILYSI
ncbi:uncharacterized protein BX664DRAFT_335423 [Halteromyces radiatus]|uniref:uncharacterized protein n=1 Tax=Halteromyces radiatus TaxID=101107 RepID=UPI0022200EDE|nr:uncharacterized protein BX664DRAFT_335423 [Halteromyces radiatus]KAI8086284.1 hypothetical protein BX664DRAFT_335423 [Halteromyces radiatus]